MKKLIQELRTELVKTINGAKKERLSEGTYFKSYIDTEKVFSLPNEVQLPYNKVLILLREKSHRLGLDISDDKLERMFDSFLLDILYNETEKRLGTIDREIKFLFKEIKAFNKEENLFIIPINNIQVKDALTIGNSEIISLTEEKLETIKKKFAIKSFSLFDEDEKTIEKLNKRNETNNYIVLTVEASDISKAKEIAFRQADYSLHVLRLFYRDAPFRIRNEKKNHFNVNIIHVNLTTKQVSDDSGVENIDFLIPPPIIDTKKIQIMKENGLIEINQLLLKDETLITQLEESLLTAIFWFGSAMKESSRDISFIQLMTALETMLIPDGGQSKQHRLASRFTSIIYGNETEEEQKEVYELMKDLYQIRNSLLHSGKGYVFDENLNQAKLWTQVLIMKLLKEIHNEKNMKALLENKYPVDEQLYKPNIISKGLMVLSKICENTARKISK
ncbi:MAG: hypothetical protein ACTSX6_06895 [Candidatus Heimdallarchaeaceae archaeon]